MSWLDVKNDVVLWGYIIAFLYHCFVTHMANYERVFKIIIEDTIIEMHCRDGGSILGLYKWLTLRMLLVDACKSLDQDTVHISQLFKQLHLELRATKSRTLTDDQANQTRQLIEELEVYLMREFNLAGVNEKHILVSCDMFYYAITYVIDTKGG